MEKGAISKFITHHYRHFNSASLVDAAKAYEQLLSLAGIKANENVFMLNGEEQT